MAPAAGRGVGPVPAAARRRGARRPQRAGRATCALAACALTAALLAALPPAPADRNGIVSGDSPAVESARSDGATIIDWAYWTSVNPDVVGWIEVPGTSIDGPVVQAPAEDPGYYLGHDVYRQPSASGCFYLDAGCAEGLDSPNCIISGHNMADGSQFAPVRGYLDASFAAEHRAIIVHEPNGTRAFEVVAARTVDGGEPAKRTAFASQEALRAWLAEQIAGAAAVLDADAADGADRIATLVTCMPGGARRALVFAVQRPAGP